MLSHLQKKNPPPHKKVKLIVYAYGAQVLNTLRRVIESPLECFSCWEGKLYTQVQSFPKKKLIV